MMWGGVTRSGLFFEALRIIKDTKPKYAIAENVKALTSKKFREEFMTVLSSLKEAGYNNYFKVLNAKDYGIPQNRERVFIVSIRSDIDDGFVFPKEEELKLKLKDFLENDVDEKYYVKCLDYFIRNSLDNEKNGNGFKFSAHIKENADICNTLTARFGVMTSDYIIDLEGANKIVFREKMLKIRKLTPTECWRLMGFTDADVKKCMVAGVSDNQLYKQAGNSIVVKVLERILEGVWKNEI